MRYLPLAKCPTLSGKRIALRVTPQAERAIRSGHPWLFDRAIQEESHVGFHGDLAVIFDRKRRFLAIGLYDPDSPLRVRILHHGKPATIDSSWFRQRIEDAFIIRRHLPATGTTGYRLIHGENDGLPGLVVDRYNGTLVVKLYTASWAAHLATILDELLAVQESECVVLRLSRAIQGVAESWCLSDGMLLVGAAVDGPVLFEENGLIFEADPIKGQKTGFFLDQRDNRAEVAQMAAGKRVLNVFAYSGGFSLYAARGGAKEVTSLDISQHALNGAERNFTYNLERGIISKVPHHLLKADAFQALSDLAHSKKSYEMVIIDPPALAKRQSEVERALAAYMRLAKLGLDLLAPQGTIVLASCSSRVDADTFCEVMHRAARETGRPLNEIRRTEHPVDHPIGFKEGAYLKCLFATA
ncbi:MAG: class I SAM-dependent rRNA methyltransferase [Chloroflexota bacterium]